MEQPETLTDSDEREAGPVFVSYATADRKKALTVCNGIERRGTKCWISSRDVLGGENYQEAIVRSIRTARAMLLVFSQAANNSDEIKKELSLASKYKVPVLALRIEDVEPSDAFAYELSTRQWIDAFGGWDRAIDAVAQRLQAVSGRVEAASEPSRSRATPGRRLPRLRLVTAAALALIAAAGVAAWLLLRPTAAEAHSMTVRLAGFQLLSAGLPQTVRDSLDAEISAAFNADGVIGVSTATGPPPGTAPAYALGGTIHRVGHSIRVITRFTNERSGAVLWSDSINYDADQVPQIARKVAIDAGIVVRCGLSGASTYRKPLPDRSSRTTCNIASNPGLTAEPRPFFPPNESSLRFPISPGAGLRSKRVTCRRPLWRRIPGAPTSCALPASRLPRKR